MLIHDDRQLTQTTLMVSDLLGLYRAELARILGLYCSDIADLANQRSYLTTNSMAGQQAILLIELHQQLMQKFENNEVAIYHWLRVDLSVLQTTPLLAMVDDLRLNDLLHYLKKGA